ncbi:MAG: sigma-70 family RNA polymerase sigma factor [Xanthomonadales bacterium]|nr:sigma-70 family RNA polymerase sigma factor [Xanthomonadales bacterium]
MNAITQTDRDALTRLLLAAAQGDQQAFAKLYQLTSAKLYGVCVRMLHNRDEADDVLQETYVTVWRSAKTFDGSRASPMTWLITITRNKAIDRLRKHRETLSDEPIELASTDPSPAADAQSSEERQRLQRCLDQLDAPQRGAVCAAFFRGATYMELAAQQKVPLGTMKSWIRRSLIRLRTCLEP